MVLPLIPMIEWLYSIYLDVTQLSQIEGASIPLSMILVYYPARIFALLGFTFMFYQFILAARLPVMESVYKRLELIKSHRLLGKVGFVLMLFHGLFLLLFDVLEQGTLSFTLGKMLGISALFLLIISVIAAWHAKALGFELQTWKRFHLATYIVFPLAFIHAITIGTVAGSFGPTQVLYPLYLLIYLYIAFRKVQTVRRDKREAEIKAVAARMLAESRDSSGKQL